MDCPTCAKPAEPGEVDCHRCGERLLHPGYGAPFPRYALSAVGGLGKSLTGLLSVSAVTEAVQVAFSLGHGPVGPMTALNLLLFLAIVPVFLVWFFRVRKNAGMWGPQSRAQGWTIGAWFTPVVNLWFPVQIMRDVWRASSSERAEHRSLAALTAAWWTCWILSWPTGVQHHTVHGIGPDGSMVVTHQTGLYMDSTAASALCLSLAAILMERVIARITAMQTARGVA